MLVLLMLKQSLFNLTF